MFDPDTLQWRCDVCKDERPDEQISVHKKTTIIAGAKATMNIKYCNDRQKCIDKAPLINLFGMGDDDKEE